MVSGVATNLILIGKGPFAYDVTQKMRLLDPHPTLL